MTVKDRRYIRGVEIVFLAHDLLDHRDGQTVR
jgi:hypothetical protein